MTYNSPNIGEGIVLDMFSNNRFPFMDSKFVCLTASKDISRMDDTPSFEKIFVFMLKDGYMPMYAYTVISVFNESIQMGDKYLKE